MVIVFSDVDAVQQDLPLLRVVQAAEQFDERGLARAVFSDNGIARADFEADVQLLKRPRFRAWVFEGNVFEFYVVFAVAAFLSWDGALYHRIGYIKEAESSPEVGRIRRQAARSAEQIVYRMIDKCQRAGVLRDGANRKSAAERL